MKIYVTAHHTPYIDSFFPDHLMERLHALGEVSRNPYDRSMTREELEQVLPDTDILVTTWGTPQVDAAMLEKAPHFKMLAHGAGTVAHIASEAFWEKGIPVLSANPIMARTVAEATLAYILAGLRRIPQADDCIRGGGWMKLPGRYSLLGSSVGLIGFGAVARNLIPLLSPFHCQVWVYDPYLSEDALKEWPFARKCTFEEAMRQNVVSIHAAQMPETYHMVNAAALSLMPDHALLVNTARGSLVDTEALIKELETGRISAVLDVYEQEGAGQQPKELLELKDQCILQPHIAALSDWHLTEGIVEDLERFFRNEPMKLQVTLRQFQLMTQE